jgi:hypothetical protein
MPLKTSFFCLEELTGSPSPGKAGEEVPADSQGLAHHPVGSTAVPAQGCWNLGCLRCVFGPSWWGEGEGSFLPPVYQPSAHLPCMSHVGGAEP